MDISKDLDRCIYSQHHWLLLNDLLALISQCNDMFSSEGEVAIAIELSSPLSWSEQVIQEKGVESVN
jgi:hypothetical protein